MKGPIVSKRKQILILDPKNNPKEYKGGNYLNGDMISLDNSVINGHCLDHIECRVEAYTQSVIDLPVCAWVGRSVIAHKESKILLPKCHGVYASVRGYEDSEIDLRNCKSIGWYLDVYRDSKINLDFCLKIYGSLILHEGAIISLPRCVEIRNIILKENSTLHINKDIQYLSLELKEGAKIVYI